MTGMDTLTPATWTIPWTGPTVWVAMRFDWEDTEILGVATTVEKAWEIVRASRYVSDGLIFWFQRPDGKVYNADGSIGIIPYELAGA